MVRSLLCLALLLPAGCSDDDGGPTASGSTGGGDMCNAAVGNLSGNVLIDMHDGNAPQPSADTEFTFKPSDGSAGITAKSDAAGTYTVTLPADTYSLEGSAGRCAPIPEPQVTVTPCGDDTFDVTLELCLGNDG